MKFQKSKLYKKIFVFITGTVFLFLPVLIFWLSITNLEKQIHNEKTTVIENQLLRKMQAVEQTSSPYFEIYRDISLFFNEAKDLDRILVNLENQKAFIKTFRKHFSDLKERYGLPVLVSANLKGINGTLEFNFSDDEQVKENRITRLNRAMYEFYCLQKAKNAKEKSKLQIQKHLKELKGYFNLSFFDSRFPYYTRHFFRNGAKELMLITAKVQNSFVANLLVDFSSITQQKLAGHKLLKHSDANTSIAFLGEANTGFKNLFSSRFKQNPVLTKQAVNHLKQLPDKLLSFKIADEIFLVTASAPQKNYRLLLSYPLPKPEMEKELLLLLALVSIAALTMWKLLVEYIFLNLKPKLSINHFVILLFLIAGILPLLSSIYLGGEFLIAEFKKAKNVTAENLEQYLENLDIENMDNIRSSLNKLKGLDRIYKIKQFTNLPEGTNFSNQVKGILKKFIKPDLTPLIKEVWVYDKNREFGCIEWVDDKKAYLKGEIVNPLIAQNIKPRFDEYLKQVNKDLKKNKNDIEMDQLKLELIDNIFLHLFGQKTYFRLKENIGILLQLKTFYDKNLFISIPVLKDNRCEYILTYVFTSPNLRNHFPVKKLSSNKVAKAFALYGTETYFRTVPDDTQKIQNHFPEMLKIAKESHLSKYRLQHEFEEKGKSSLIIAHPANYSDYIISSKKHLKSLASLKIKLAGQAFKAIAILALLLLFFSTITAQYFILPIRQLTLATKEIINKNFQVRVATKHPDEFADMTTTFNKMARSLEEGKLLKSFVSSNITRQLENDQKQIKAERKNVTVVFSGIKNFSTNFKTDNPEKQFEILQQHLQAATEACEKYNGELDKLIDDKAMLVFEDLPNQEPSVDRAIKAALQMEKQITTLTGQVLATGINSGTVVAGVMGSEKVRLAYTVVGDPVNLAARLASIAEKEKEQGLIISANAAQNSKLNLNLKKLDIETVKGKTQSVKIFRLKFMA